jgi:hypothetical protein
LLTTGGLLFTGELLDHVAVRCLKLLKIFAVYMIYFLALESYDDHRRIDYHHTCHPQSEGKSRNEPVRPARDGGKCRRA